MPAAAPPKEHQFALDHDIQVGRPLCFKKAAVRAAVAAMHAKTSVTEKFAKAAKAKKFKQARLDKSGNTPLINAVIKNDLPALRRRLKVGDDPNQRGKNSWGAAPLYLVAQGHAHDLAKALIKGGATVDAETLNVSINYMIGHHRGESPQTRVDFLMIDAWKAQGGNVAELSAQLHSAAHANDPDLIQKLAASGADVNHRREYERPYSTESGQMTPVMCAIGGEGDSIDTLRCLIDLGADAKEALNYAQSRRRLGDDAFTATPLGAFLTAAAEKGTLLTKDEAHQAAHEGLVDDMLKNPPPGLKYSGRKIDRKAVEAHIRRRR
jgi:hypothetical protein